MTSCPNSPHIFPTCGSQHFAGMSVNTAVDSCCWLVLQHCGWGIVVSGTNLEGWPCSVLLSSYSVRQEQHVLLHPISSLVILYICTGPALHLKVPEVEDEILLCIKGCQYDCQATVNFKIVLTQQYYFAVTPMFASLLSCLHDMTLYEIWNYIFLSYFKRLNLQ